MEKNEFNPKIIAFYLPQYHPIKENNEWFGEGFTEWTNVAKSRPLYKGHVQPKVPTTLGFYDLRVPEVRERQAELANEAGISAFCYYHYWFGNGRVILEQPLQWLIESGKPDFPFCLCWANHSWKRKNWNPDTKVLEEDMLLEQLYPGDVDIIAHFNYLLPAFKDKRYYKIDGKLVFSIYDTYGYPHFDRLKTIWDELAKKNGLPGFFFIAYTSHIDQLSSVEFKKYDMAMLSLITNIQFHQDYSLISRGLNKLKEKLSEWTGKPLLLYDFDKVKHLLLDRSCREVRNIPVIFPNWDYTPRRGAGGLILKNCKPDLFYKHVCEAFELIKDKPTNRQVIFLKSWNEWGEGNYMEPDLEYGKGYIEFLAKAINDYKKK